MRYVSVLVVISVALVTAVSCGSDKKSTSNPGVDAGTTCKGVYSDQTFGDLTSKASTGACTSSADLEAVCVNDVNSAASSCGLSCNSQGGTDDEKVQCTSDCMKQTLNPAPSDACVGCYIASVACSLAHCLQPCLAGAADPGCTACRVKFGCAPTFYDNCSGLPVPTGLDLGSGGGAGTSGGGAAGSSAGGGSNAGAGGSSAGAGGGATAGAPGGGSGGATP